LYLNNGNILYPINMTDIDMLAIIGLATTIAADKLYKGNADKVWTDEEYMELGKAAVEVLKEVQEMESLEGQII
jgi:hypothetical protein